MSIDGPTVLMSLVSLAFVAWAGVVAWIGHGIRSDFGDIKTTLKDLRTELKSESEKLNQYIVQTETRLAVLEDKAR